MDIVEIMQATLSLMCEEFCFFFPNHYKIKLIKLNKYLAVLILISQLCSEFDQFVHLHSMAKNLEI